METKQLIAGIIMTIGIFGIGFGFGYNYYWNECHNTLELSNFSSSNILQSENTLGQFIKEDFKNGTMEYTDFR